MNPRQRLQNRERKISRWAAGILLVLVTAGAIAGSMARRELLMRGRRIDALQVNLAAARWNAAQQQRRGDRIAEEFTAYRDAATAGAEASRRQIDELTSALEAAESQAKARGQVAALHEAMFEGAVHYASVCMRKEEPIVPREMLKAAGKALQARRARQSDAESLAAAEYSLARRFILLGEDAEAEPLLRRCLTRQREALQPTDRRLIETITQLGYSLAYQGKWEEAAPLQREVVALTRSTAKREGSLRTPLQSLRDSLIALDRLDEAESSWREIAAIDERSRSGGDMAAMRLVSFGGFLQGCGKLAEAEAVLRRAVAYFVQEKGEDHEWTFRARCRLAWVLALEGEGEEARALHDLVVDTARFMREIKQSFINADYGEYLTWLGAYEESEYYLLADLAEHARWTRRPALLNECRQRLVALYEAWGKEAEAERYRKEIVRAIPMEPVGD